MVNMLTVEHIIEARRVSRRSIVLYVNSTAEAEALADVTFASINAAKVVPTLELDVVIFDPNKNPSHYVVAKITDRKIIPVSTKDTATSTESSRERTLGGARKLYPNAKLMIRPECES